MDYFTRYGLEFNPFIKNSKEILVDTSEYRETIFRLDYLAKTKGFGLLTGSPGRGKTTTIRSWASNLWLLGSQVLWQASSLRSWVSAPSLPPRRSWQRLA